MHTLLKIQLCACKNTFVKAHLWLRSPQHQQHRCNVTLCCKSYVLVQALSPGNKYCGAYSFSPQHNVLKKLAKVGLS